ncbi:LysR family transcriptional regulator [Jannaschia seohaensis]|uniref:LysR family glycine cleavage system transcriptional activator n=1 Tax=Jannaschia seohaensis TaxID=475081 RepID=A0A2Y9AIM3_9RHOB|nr:LysR family transcriptional regulator [Jannaschia seohaensis]PWJ20188.1 LysR family glycine cleavage system transcriptional activator [Jannaschia seohaensis]SSA44170.1 LysR family transcriptional regulator, glycine cleavage system transcriptional activator [Jannaschia seohaensis]
MNDAAPDILRKLASAAPLLAAISRTGSFTAAGMELGLKQSAVSHKIRALEADLGYALFSRTTRQVEPTGQGRLLCQAAQASVETLTAALERIAQLDSTSDTVLSLPSSLALKWLVPAMSRAFERGLRISLEIEDELTQLQAEGSARMAIRFGPGPYPGLHAQLLSKCAVMPVSGPAVPSLEHARRGRPAILLRDARAEQDGTSLSWEDYLDQTGMGDIATETGATFRRTDVVLQAAIGAAGHALGRSLLVEQDIADGLLALRGPEIPLKSRYWIVARPDYAQTKAFKRVADWLISEARRSQDLMKAVAGRR